MKRKISNFLICVLCVMLLLPMTVHADIGPKPSVRITFEGLGDALCYGTLLSKTKTTGPSSAWDGVDAHAQHNENANYYYAELDYATWKAFAEYEDSDGYYFLQEGWQVNETKELAWTYYPPNSFKILLYFPESGSFVVSGIYEKYAFDSYFTVDMEGINISSVNSSHAGGDVMVMTAEKSYDYTWEIISLAVRIVITILLEFAIAIIFGYWAKQQLLVIGGVNIVTQVVLNVALNVINYQSGYLAFILFYVIFEILVFALEALVFYGAVNAYNERPRKKGTVVWYALVANAASFIAGYEIARIIPGIF